ncbi:MAG: excisionase family DNA-binding protein [Candidatus Dormibacteraceae bacterium]
MISSDILTLNPNSGDLRNEAEQFTTALSLLDHQAKIVGAKGEEIELPSAIFDAMAAIAESLRQGDGITLVPVHHLLTTTLAANLLNVSRPHLLSLLKDGKIPFQHVGTHKRVRLGDILAYRKNRDLERESALTDLVHNGQKLGLPY